MDPIRIGFRSYPNLSRNPLPPDFYGCFEKNH